MSTNSKIALELPNGKVKSVYCHWDGYPSGVGKDLIKKNFKNTKEVEEFINEGDRSTVDISYKEWRDENCPPKEHESVKDFFESNSLPYAYLFTNECKWVYKSAGNTFLHNLSK